MLRRVFCLLLSLCVLVLCPIAPVAGQHDKRQKELDTALLEEVGATQPNRINENATRVVDLLDKGAHPNARTKDGDTALISASSWSYTESALRLLGRGARVNIPNHDGNTALIFAASRDNPKLVRLLLANGANVHHRNQEGKTALDYAKQNRAKAVLPVLHNAIRRNRAIPLDKRRILILTSVASFIEKPKQDRSYSLRVIDKTGKEGRPYPLTSYGAPQILVLPSGKGKSYLSIIAGGQASEAILLAAQGFDLMETWSESSKQRITSTLTRQGDLLLRIDRLRSQVYGGNIARPDGHVQEVFRFRDGSIQRVDVIELDRKSSPRPVPPAFASVLGIVVGIGTTDQVGKRYGYGKVATGMHPNSRCLWQSQERGWYFSSDGWTYADHSPVIESLWIRPVQSVKEAKTAPRISPPRKALGVWKDLKFGMSQQEVLHNLGSQMPAPKVSSDQIVWKVRRFVRIREKLVERTWTACAGFEKSRLTDIQIDCEEPPEKYALRSQQ